MAIDLLMQPVEKNNTINLLDTRPQVSDADAEIRSQRYHYATQNLMRIDEIRAGVMLGYEERLREKTALDEQIKEGNRRQALIKNISGVAASENRPLTEDEKNQIIGISNEESTIDPKTILERLYAQRFSEELIASAPEATEIPEETTAAVRDFTSDFLAKQQIAQRIYEEQSSRFQKAGFGIQAIDFVEGMIPGLSWLRQQNRIKGTGSDALLSGENKAQQIRGLYFQSPEDFEKNLREAVESLSNESVFDALDLAKAAVDYSDSDEGWDNVFAAMDAVDIATLGAGSALALARRARGAVRATKAGTSINRKVALGDIEAAADEAVLGRVSIKEGKIIPNAGPDATRPQQQVAAIVDAYPTMFNPGRRMDNPGSLTAARQQRLMIEMTNNQNQLLSTLDLPFVERVTDEGASQYILDAAKRRFLVTNHRLDQAIIETRPVLESQETFGGVDYIEFLIGHKDGVGFVSDKAAQNFASVIYRLTPGSYTIKEESGNWFIRMIQNVDETDINAAFKRISTDNKAPETFLNQWIWGMRSADYLVSAEHSKWRKLLTYGGNAVMDRVQNSIKNLTSLRKNEASRLRDVMEEAQFMTRNILQPDGTYKAVSGQFYDTVGEFEQAYMKRHNQLPSDRETMAYFEFRDIMDWDHLMRNISVLRDKNRLGMHQFSFDYQAAIEGTKETQKRTLDLFEGRVLEDLPSMGTGPVRVGWINDKGKARFGKYDRLFQKDKDEIDDLIKSGEYQIIQVADPRSPVMKDVFKTYGEPVQVVIVKNPKQAPLNWVQVPYNEGGHWNYSQTGLYIKQAKVHRGMGEFIYDGDTTFYHAPVRSVADQFAKDMETARLMRNNKDPRLTQFVTAKLPFKNMKDFESRWYDPVKNPDGPFSPESPFVVTEHNQSAKDVIKLEDFLQSPVFDAAGDANSLSSKIFSSYTQERSDRLLSVDTVGTQTNPVYKLSPAPTLDPFKSLAISAGGLVRSRFLDDYKHRAIEDWVTQFSSVIDAPLNEIRSNPLKALKEGNWRKDVDNNVLAAAKANRIAILSLMGQETNFHQAWKYTRQKMVDLVYQRLGKKPAMILDDIFWNSKTDPAVLMRSIVFHAKLGLLNPAQAVLQASTAAMAMAIDGNPQRVARSVTLYPALRAAQAAAINPKAQRGIFEAAAKATGMDVNDVEQMFHVWQKSGANIIEGEYGPLDDAINPKEFMSKSTGKKALDSGLFFFREGNQIHRGSAFTLAYLKWLDENPGKALKNRDIAVITNRMDNLYLNMSRASNAAWQNNPEAWYQPLTTTLGQFAAFPSRLMEEFLGGVGGGRFNLTGMEKARLMMVNSLLWGIPFGAGSLALGGLWPVGESIKEYIAGNALPYDDNVVTKVLVDGVADVIAEQLIGTDVNVTERFGPGGVSIFKDIFTGEWGDVLGASPNFINQALMSMEPFWTVTGNLFKDGPRPSLVWEDFIGPLQEVSSAYQGLRAYLAYNAGEWVNKSGKTIDRTTIPKGDAKLAIAIALGLTPQEVTDMYARYQNTAALQEDKRHVTDLALREFNRYIKAASEGDMEQAMVFYKRADAYLTSGGFTTLEKAQIQQRAYDENRTMMERVDKDFWLAKPEERTDWFIDREERRIQMGY